MLIVRLGTLVRAFDKEKRDSTRSKQASTRARRTDEGGNVWRMDRAGQGRAGQGRAGGRRENEAEMGEKSGAKSTGACLPCFSPSVLLLRGSPLFYSLCA